MITLIKAIKNGVQYSWTRSTLGDFIETIPEKIEREGGWKECGCQSDGYNQKREEIIEVSKKFK